MKKINVMFLVLSMNVGGTERHLLDLVLNMNREKFNPMICCLRDLGSLGREFVSIEQRTKVYSNLIGSKYDLSGVWKVLQILRKENIHILFTINSPLTQIWGTVLAWLSGINAFITRVATTKPRFHVKRRKIVNKTMLSFVDSIIAQADTHKQYLIGCEGMKKEKIKVIYNGVALERFNKTNDSLELKETLGIGTSDPVVGIVARLAPEKGHSIFLMAAKNVVNEFPRTRFLIIGDGIEKQKLESFSHELGLGSNVIFLGTRNDIPQLLSIFDIAVLSSNPEVETVSNAILEYMAAAKPVVATNAGSTVDLVSNGETGYIVPCDNHDALSDAIVKLLNNKSVSEKMGKAGRSKVEKEFTLGLMVKKYESLFTDLVK